MHEEMDRSIARGSAHKWWVAEKYRIRDGAIIPIGEPNERWKDYAPFAYPELPTALSKLKDGDEKRVLGFVHKWGLLGYGSLLLDDTPDPYEALKRRAGDGRDTIEWIRKHAMTVDMILYLLDRRRISRENSKPDIIWDAIKDVMRPYATTGALAGVLYAQGSFDELKTHFVMGDPNKPEEILARLLKAVIEPNIQYLRDSLLVEDDGSIVRSKSFPALLSVIYSHLADAATGERTYVKCRYERCGNYFLQTEPRQRYCPDLPGKESLCSLRARRRRFRSKQDLNKKEV